jgi:hypothetical protein
MTRVDLVSSSLSLHYSNTVNHPDSGNDWSVLHYSLRYTYLRPHPHTCVEYGRLNETGRINKSKFSFVVSWPWRIKSMRFANILLRGRGIIISQQRLVMTYHGIVKFFRASLHCILECQHINEVVVPYLSYCNLHLKHNPTLTHWNSIVLPEELKLNSLHLHFDAIHYAPQHSSSSQAVQETCMWQIGRQESGRSVYL